MLQHAILLNFFVFSFYFVVDFIVVIYGLLCVSVKETPPWFISTICFLSENIELCSNFYDKKLSVYFSFCFSLKRLCLSLSATSVTSKSVFIEEGSRFLNSFNTSGLIFCHA